MKAVALIRCFGLVSGVVPQIVLWVMAAGKPDQFAVRYQGFGSAATKPNLSTAQQISQFS
jgi:hypothetical protein